MSYKRKRNATHPKQHTHTHTHTLKRISFTTKRSAIALVAPNSSLHTQTELAMTNHSKQLIGDTLHDAIKSSRKMARAFYIAFGGEIDATMF